MTTQNLNKRVWRVFDDIVHIQGGELCGMGWIWLASTYDIIFDTWEFVTY